MVCCNGPDTQINSRISMPLSDSKLTNETFFSTIDFVAAWTKSSGGRHTPLAIPIVGSGPPRTMYTVQVSDRYWSRVIPIIGVDFCLSPGWRGQLERSTLEGILRGLMRLRTRRFAWHVRFDHAELAAGFQSLGLASEPSPTQVIYLEGDYERVFAGYNATTRNHVRKSLRRGTTVKVTVDPVDVIAYYRLYRQLASQKGWKKVYTLELSLELIKLSSAVQRFLIAECEGQIIGGGLFVRDGCSVYVLHTALDHNYSHFYPVCAVYDEAIRWACETGAAFFNFGGYGHNSSLRQFKSSWGTREELNRLFTWENPLWMRAAAFKGAVRKSFDVF
jgi:hypothetical protein